MRIGRIGCRARFAICILLSVLAALFFQYRASAAVETGENYVMYDFREYDGDSSLPYGRGSNADCYYPQTANASYVFPEVYTWTSATLSETCEGVLLRANNSGTSLSATLDKVPAMYRQSVQRHLRYLLLRIKANTYGKNTVTFSSLGSSYRKTCNVVYTGEWQTIVIDLQEVDGWEKKNSDGSYSDCSSSPWVNQYFGTDGFGVRYDSFGDNVRNEIIIKYYAFSDCPDLLLTTGKLTEHLPYIEGFDDGLFHGADTFTRSQGFTVAARLIFGKDGIPKAEKDMTEVFDDVSKEDYCYDAVSALYCLGLLEGYQDKLSVNEPMTSSELAALIIRSGLYKDNCGTKTELSAGSRGGKRLSRAQACMLINNLTGRKAADFATSPFEDVSENNIGYGDIISASHTVITRKTDDGTVSLEGIFKAPDYDKTELVISELDKASDERIDAVRNTDNTVTSFAEKVYYVSPDGNDSNSGTSPDSPWRTLKKVNAVGFTAGSTVLFERGGLWRGQVIVRNGVTYSSYGSGEKPRFYGSSENGADVSKWTLVEGTDNVWRYETPMPDCGSVVINDGEYMSVKDIPSYVSGVYYHRNSSKVYDYRTNISTDLGIFCDNKNRLSENCTLYMRCDNGNPGALFDSIEFMPRMNIFNVTSSDKGAVIDNLTIMYGGAHAVGAGNVTGLTVTNCEIGFIGGSIQNYNAGGGTMPVRYGNGVEIYGGCDGYTVRNNYIHRVYDAGITHQLGSNNDARGIQKNICYSDNVIEYCSYSIEYFLGASTDGVSDRYMENVVIENNIMRFAGFGFGNQRTDRLCMSHIKSGGSENKVSGGFIIRNNIFDRSREMLINVTAAKSEYLPIFENNTYIQYLTSPETEYSTFGKYGQGSARLRFFSEKIRDTMKNIGFEQAPNVYFARKDSLFELK